MNELSNGDIVTMTSFTHSEPGLQIKYKAENGAVAVFLLLGHVDKKNIGSFDCAKALNDLGWVSEEEVIK